MKIKKIHIICPIYNDWLSAQILVKRIDDLSLNQDIDISLIDDGSSELINNNTFAQDYQTINEINILPLCRNVGHQRAIALGLAYVEAHFNFDCIIIMDGDGEDRPTDIPRLIQTLEDKDNPEIIFAKRGKRSESLLFKIGYYAYLMCYRILTGLTITAGNFSIVPYQLVRKLTNVSELWMNYSSSVLKLRLPLSYITADRGSRYDGHTKMNFVSLVLHAFQAISIHREAAGVRIIFFCIVSIASIIIAIVVVVAIRLFTELAIPGWATNVVGFFSVMLFQLIGLSLFFIFLVLGGRSTYEVIPSRDYQFYTCPCVKIYPHE